MEARFNCTQLNLTYKSLSHASSKSSVEATLLPAAYSIQAAQHKEIHSGFPTDLDSVCDSRVHMHLCAGKIS